MGLRAFPGSDLVPKTLEVVGLKFFHEEVDEQSGFCRYVGSLMERDVDDELGQLPFGQNWNEFA